MSLDDKNINTKDDFVIFLNKLAKDYEANPGEWESKGLADYFSSMAGWINDMEGYYKNNNLEEPKNIPWSFIAKVFLAAKIYE